MSEYTSEIRRRKAHAAKGNEGNTETVATVKHRCAYCKSVICCYCGSKMNWVPD